MVSKLQFSMINAVLAHKITNNIIDFVQSGVSEKFIFL